ncbi:unnamed protein product [Pleuronectes platessa]|uniref:Uncharacterized protein n=1 Tax=Pleuronectes platessa TaxID=8262 RepID=A0A9N7UU22_PLEPL|nr:unnamed protein product [Pleuronectes platessa]
MGTKRRGGGEDDLFFSLTNIHFTPSRLEQSKSQQAATSGTAMPSSTPQCGTNAITGKDRGPTEHICGDKVTNCAEAAQHKQPHPPCVRPRLAQLPLVQILDVPLVALCLSGPVRQVLPCAAQWV